jgi:hypothetical protein
MTHPCGGTDPRWRRNGVGASRGARWKRAFDDRQAVRASDDRVEVDLDDPWEVLGEPRESSQQIL